MTTKRYTPLHPSPLSGSEESPAYRALKASMDASEMWASLPSAERLAVILGNFPPDEWFREEELTVLATYRRAPPGKWGEIKAIYKTIGGNPFDLEQAVDGFLATRAPHPSLLEDAPQPDLFSFDTVTATAVEWLWWPYLSLGALAMLDGEPGVGKSLLSIALAAVLSRGWSLPDQQGTITSGTIPSTTLLMNAEDSLSSTIRPRLDAVGADCSRVFALTGWHTADAPDDQQVFSLEHIPILEKALGQCQARLVILDPIQAYLGTKVDMNRANETRPLLTQLTKIAERERCAIVLVRHPAKSGMGSAMQRGLGSIDFIGAARTALFVQQHPSDPDTAFVCQSKNNLGPLGRTQIFTKKEGQFRWAGVSRLTAELLAGSGRGPDPHAFLDAACWLEQRLMGGLAWPATDLESEGESEGHAQRTLYRAKKALGVISKKNQDGWSWRLEPIPPRLPGSLGSLEPLGSLGSLGNVQPPTHPSSTVLGSLGSLEPLGSLGSLGNVQSLQRDMSEESHGGPSPDVVDQESQDGQDCQDCQVSQVSHARDQARRRARDETSGREDGRTREAETMPDHGTGDDQEEIIL